MDPGRVPSGSPDLDLLLNGGFEPGTITQFFGEPAGGKSSVCILAAVTCLLSGRSVVFIDTEGFSIERFRQIAGENATDLAEHLYIYEPTDFDQQRVMIAGMDTVLRTRNVGLIIVDSATALYRMNLEKGWDAMQKLTRQVVLLLGLAKRYRIPVIVTNQVYMDTVKNVYAGLGGTALEHISKAIIRFSRLQGSVRRATLMKHRSLPAGDFFDFEITGTGIQNARDPSQDQEPKSG
jgi:DNA repair protein RadB